MGPLRPDTVATVRAFLRCGDLAAGFTRYHCPDCGHWEQAGGWRIRILGIQCSAHPYLQPAVSSLKPQAHIVADLLSWKHSGLKGGLEIGGGRL